MFDKNEVTFDGITYKVSSHVMAQIKRKVTTYGTPTMVHHKVNDKGDGVAVAVDKILEDGKYEAGMEAVFDLICEERDYQDAMFDDLDCGWSPSDWLVFLEYYVENGRNALFGMPNLEIARDLQMCMIRKIGALAVAAMEHNRTPSRSEESENFPKLGTHK